VTKVDARVERAITLFLCGDVMTGRGVDQVLPHPGDPALRERYVADATTYVELAEATNGPIPRPVDFDWPWGDALRVLDEVAPDVRIINLETSVTRSADFARGKAVHYRMNPLNVPCLAAAGPDVCVLANNHVMDFGSLGLVETVDALAAAGLRTAGAGRDADLARRPAVVPVTGGASVLVLTFGLPSSGVPPDWAATADRPGVDVLPGLSDSAAAQVVDRVAAARQPAQLAVVSIHWGSNWGYDIEPDQRRFAHRLIDGGVDLVHGHSSHHPRPIEIYRDRLVLYGCGDFVNDYEGIRGHERYRDDLRPMYFASLEPGTGRLLNLRIITLRARRMRLHAAPAADAAWLSRLLERISDDVGARFDLAADGTLSVLPA